MTRHARNHVLVRTAGLVASALAAIALCPPAQAADAADLGLAKHPATIAALAWMQITDSGDYAKGWDEAGPIFQSAVTTDQWTEIAKKVRVPLGKCSSRTPSRYTEQIEVPTPEGKTLAGEFAVVRFKSVFEKMPRAIETVSMQKQADGAWKVIGYYIKAET